MYLLIDDTVDAFHLHYMHVVWDETRHYYVSTPPYRAIIVCHGGLTLPALRNLVVYAFLSYDFGNTGLCVDGYVGHRHRKITIQRVAAHVPERTLTQVVRSATH